jgi:indolepyruvate ferredoxin oxidoreductase
VNAGMADALLACDILVAGHDKIIPALDPTRTRGIINTERNFTGDFARDGDLAFPADTLQGRLQQSTLAEESCFFQASEVARILLGDALGANMLLTGFAWQRGLIPISEAAIHDAIALNGIAVEWNVEAFEWGRCLAHQPSLIDAILSSTAQPVTVVELDSPTGIIERNTRELSAYQNPAYGQRYRDWLERFASHMSEAIGEDRELLKAVATTLFKLMAYKDEYEVARLHSDPAFHQKLAAQFEGDYRIRFNLAPPLFSPVDKHTGLPRKISLGSWLLPVFGLLARCRALRGTALDPFGYTAERKMERSLITDYQVLIEQLLPDLCGANRDLFLEIATLPLSVKGYGHVKQAAYQKYREALAKLQQQWPGQSAQQAA